MYEKLLEFKKQLEIYHEEKIGESFGYRNNQGNIEHYTFSDYTGELLDSIGDLIGVIEMSEGER